MSAARLSRACRVGARTAALLLALAACGDGTPTSPRRAEPLEVLPRPLTAGEQAAIAAGNEFSIALFREVNARKAGQNVFVSPFSAAAALGMTLNGANGATFDAMRGALGLSGRTPQEINEAYRGLTSLLLSLDRSVTLGIANAIFHRQGFPIEAAFLEANRTYFDAEVRGLDFRDATASLNAINGWASARTNGRIDRVLDRIADEQVMFLMNAIYFKGSWRSRFDPRLTAPLPFTRDDGTVAPVPTMHQRGMPVRLGVVDGAQVAELPYGNGAFVMTVVLPPGGTSVDAWIGSLTPARWSALLGALQEGTVDVHLPRFRLTYEDEWKDVLTALGMGIAFDAQRADFTRLSAPGGLYIGFVKQNTFVEVNEEGTEAAAVTTVGVEAVSLPPSFQVDRPFVFAVRERLSGTLLFVGKVAAP